MKRIIVCAANKYKDGTLVLGVRHFDNHMRAHIRLLNNDFSNQNWTQGFVDQYSKFYTREEAFTLAKENNRYPDIAPVSTKLFSENLW